MYNRTIEAAIKNVIDRNPTKQDLISAEFSSTKAKALEEIIKNKDLTLEDQKILIGAVIKKSDIDVATMNTKNAATYKSYLEAQ